jgi:hypothetical protein
VAKIPRGLILISGRIEATASEKHFFLHGRAGVDRIADASGQLPLLCGDINQKFCELHHVPMRMNIERKTKRRKHGPDYVRERVRWICPCCEALRKTDVPALVESVRAGTFTGRLGKWQRHVIPPALLAEYDQLIAQRAKERQELDRQRGADWRFRRKYGISVKERNELVRQQNGRCAICGDDASELLVDHCHKTGKVRQMLCHNCNSGIGLLREDPELFRKASEYCQKHAHGN